MSAGGGILLRAGTCWVFHAYNLGWSVQLKSAEDRIADPKARRTLQQKRRTKRYFEFNPHPLRVSKTIEPIQVGGRSCAPDVDMTIFDFGAVSIGYRFELPMGSDLNDLISLNSSLYESSALLEHSRIETRTLMDILGPSVQKPEDDLSAETYVIFQLQDLEPKMSVEELFERNRTEIARLLRSEPGQLSKEEINDATDLRISYSPDDLAVIDWDATLLIDRAGEDVRSVLEFVNVELMELRLLDGELDDALDEAYEVLQGWPRRSVIPGRGRSDLRRVGTLQVDGAMLFEGVNNALKLLSDQYLARVYRLGSKRFHLESWDESILRKIDVLQDIYDRMTDYVSTVRIELLEWIVIVLIVIEIALPFLSGLHGGH
ncbi:MAG TPA: hypothetical protein VL588_00945 [Bdellovibrionota bacterium]|nr:hypothetical protein [Bdellovibrionota bacterium]